MAQHHNRVALAITAYFGSATASLAWVIHRALPTGLSGQSIPRDYRSWSDLHDGATALLEPAIPGELAVFFVLNFFISALAMAAVVTTAVFLGRLSTNESRRMSHRLVKHGVSHMVFMGYTVRPEPRDVAIWLAWFAVIVYLRVFLGAAKDRLEALLSSPGAHPGRHARGVGLLLLVLVHNAAAFLLALRLYPWQSTARLLLCAFHSAVIAIDGGRTLLRYVIHVADRYPCRESSPPAALPGTGAAGSNGGSRWWRWDVGGFLRASKGGFLYHLDLGADVLIHALTVLFHLHVWLLRGMKFHLIDMLLFLEMRTALQSLVHRLRTHLCYRAATHRINNTFPDVHAADLAAMSGGGGGVDCTICMDEIEHVAKQLPCGHMFHLGCLRAWLQQSGGGSGTFTCPNCRKPILVGGSDGGEGEEGPEGQRQQRRESTWRIARVLDRAYVRAVVAVEPLVLTVLLRLTRWLGGQAQQQPRRRHARTQPSQPREGSGESPWPPRQTATASTANGHLSGDDRREREWEGDEEEEEEEEQDGAEELYGSDDSDGRNRHYGEEDEGAVVVSDYADEREQRRRRRGRRQEVAGGRGRGSEEEEEEARGYSSREEGAAAGVRTRQQTRGRSQTETGGGGGGSRVWRQAQRACGVAGGHGGCCGAASDRRTDPGEAPQPQPQPHRRVHFRERTQREEHEAATGVAAAAADAPPGIGRRANHGGGRAAHRAAAAGDGEGAGPSSGAGGRRRHRVRLPPLSTEVPSYSGDVLALHAAAAARQIGRTVTSSIRSSWGVGGVCAGAVAGGGRHGGSDDDDDDGEVSSRRRQVVRTPQRRQQQQQGGEPDGTGGSSRILGWQGGGRS